MVDCVSIFSGAGGLDVGALSAGAKIIACVENDPDAAETLRLNNMGARGFSIIENDIQNVDFRQMRSRRPTILMGGPPCQPFSKNGYWVKNNNRLIDEDPRNLIGQYLRAVDQLQPTGFLFENVESILHPTNIATFERFLVEARALGYACTVYRANSADFGVPQKRKRVFVFGVRSAKHPIPMPHQTHSDPDKPDLMNGFQPHVGVGKLIKKYSSSKFREPQEDASNGTYFYELTHVPPGKNYEGNDAKNIRGQILQFGGKGTQGPVSPEVGHDVTCSASHVYEDTSELRVQASYVSPVQPPSFGSAALAGCSFVVVV